MSIYLKQAKSAIMPYLEKVWISKPKYHEYYNITSLTITKKAWHALQYHPKWQMAYQIVLIVSTIFPLLIALDITLGNLGRCTVGNYFIAKKNNILQMSYQRRIFLRNKFLKDAIPYVAVLVGGLVLSKFFISPLFSSKVVTKDLTIPTLKNGIQAIKKGVVALLPTSRMPSFSDIGKVFNVTGSTTTTNITSFSKSLVSVASRMAPSKKIILSQLALCIFGFSTLGKVFFDKHKKNKQNQEFFIDPSVKPIPSFFPRKVVSHYLPINASIFASSSSSSSSEPIEEQNINIFEIIKKKELPNLEICKDFKSLIELLSDLQIVKYSSDPINHSNDVIVICFPDVNAKIKLQENRDYFDCWKIECMTKLKELGVVAEKLTDSSEQLGDTNYCINRSFEGSDKETPNEKFFNELQELFFD